MGAACVTHPKDDDEVTNGNRNGKGHGNMDVFPPNSKSYYASRSAAKDKLHPTSPISLLFEVMSEEIGYDASALQCYCAKLQSLWIYRVIDALNIDNETWNALEIPSVLEHVIRDYLNEVGNTDKFRRYASKSHTDIYVTFVSKDIRTLFKELLKSVNDLESAKQHIVYLEKALTERYLLNTDKLKKYMTEHEWMQLNVPTNLKAIICAKINLTFAIDAELKECPQEEEEEEAAEAEAAVQGEMQTPMDNDNDEIPLITPQGAGSGSGGGGIMPQLHNVSSMLSSKIQAIRTSVGGVTDDEDACTDIFTDIVFDESIAVNKEITVRSNMMEIAQHFCSCLLVDDVDEMYSHFRYFVAYGYYTLYHLSFIRDALFDRLLFITKTPKCARVELLELIEFVRDKYKLRRSADIGSNINHCNAYELEDISISNIMPFASNLYWEKTTHDAFTMLQEDMQLDLSNECDVLMNHLYSNVWDWQFITHHILQQLSAYQKYEIVRIRMHHIMKLCRYQYGHHNIPLLPPIWNSKYDANLLIHDIFAINNTDSNQDSNDISIEYDKFHFDGLQWNQITKRQINILVQYLDDNFVRKIQFLPIQHRKNAEIWNQLMERNNIAQHLRFKINFYAIRGLPILDDEWINTYIECNFKQNSLPQWQQSMDVDVMLTGAMQMFEDIQHKVMAIENMLHYIHVFKRIQMQNRKQTQNANGSGNDISEMNQIIRETIAEIDEMGLNHEFYQIIQRCGTKALQKFKKTNETFFCNTHTDHVTQLDELDEANWNELARTKQVLKEMKQSVYSIPIHDIVALSQTVCHSVQWLQDQLDGYKTNQ